MANGKNGVHEIFWNLGEIVSLNQNKLKGNFLIPQIPESPDWGNLSRARFPHLIAMVGLLGNCDLVYFPNFIIANSKKKNNKGGK